MASEKRESRIALKTAIKSLIFHEVRLLQLEQTSPPPFVMDEMSRSLQEAKRQVIALARRMSSRERNAHVKRMIRQSLDEEIDRAIQVRKTRCFRCIQIRYFDEAGKAHRNLPAGGGRVRVIGCETPPAPGRRCRGFKESPTAVSFEDYLSKMTYLYDLKEMFDEMKEVWKEYLTR